MRDAHVGQQRRRLRRAWERGDVGSANDCARVRLRSDADMATAADDSPVLAPPQHRIGRRRLNLRAILRYPKQVVRRALDATVESYLRIDTAVPPNHNPVTDLYEPLDYLVLRRALRLLNPGVDDVVFDVGCGMGRVLCVLARRRVRGCVGIEFDPALVRRATANVAAMRGRRSPVEVIEADATAADYSSGTAFIVFNPFEVSAQMAATLARIRAASEASGRPVRILYVNPVHEDAFEAAEWLRCTARLRSRWFSTVMSLWVSDAGDAAR